MLEHEPTPYNPPLKGSNNERQRQPCAVNCTTSDTSSPSLEFAINCTNEDCVRDLIEHSVSDNTRIAYESDLKHFTAWGGNLPASPAMIASYIAAQAQVFAVATITRRVATLSKAHQAMGEENPCQAALVKATLRGLRRKQGTAQKQAKPLLKEELFAVLNQLGESIKDVRDRALLVLGFAGGFRRSELVGLDVADIEVVRQGIIITLRRSKTDQEGAGRKIGIPHGRTKHCPVVAVTTWLERSKITQGAVFCPVTRYGHLQPVRLSGDAVSDLIRERIAAIGMNPEGYSGHSLRAGFATSAAQAGVSTLKIRAQTGHASDAMLSRYVHDGELFLGNAAGVML
jgi:site-specific recombinase XerD